MARPKNQIKWDKNHQSWRKSKTFHLPTGEKKTIQRDFRHPHNQEGYRAALQEYKRWVDEKEMEFGISSPMREVRRAVEKWNTYAGIPRMPMGVQAALIDEQGIKDLLRSVKDGAATIDQAFSILWSAINTRVAQEIDPFITDSTLPFPEICQRFLHVKKENVAKTTYNVYSSVVRNIEEWAAHHPTITASGLTEFWGWVKGKEWSGVHKQRYMHTMREVIRYGFHNNWIAELPRNLDSPMLRFGVEIKGVDAFTVEEIREILGKVEGRLRLYVLLGLNCGLTPKEICDIQEEQIANGYLTRKRVKTQRHKNVPTVSYRLWDETIELINRWGLDTTERKITHAWKKLGARLTFKHLRKTSPSILSEHRDYGRFAQLFLGQSPQTIAERHYVKTPQMLFDEALEWLGKQLLAR